MNTKTIIVTIVLAMLIATQPAAALSTAEAERQFHDAWNEAV